MDEFNLDEKDIVEKIVSFSETETKKFINKNSNLVFYAFAFDCNVEYGEINLCLNTIFDFERTIESYQTGQYCGNYQKNEEMIELKYNTGDWEYQCFSTLYLFDEEELKPYGYVVPDTEKLLAICNKALIGFRETSTYEELQKEKDFISFCVDHDEEILASIKKRIPILLRISSEPKGSNFEKLNSLVSSLMEMNFI